MPKTLLDGVNEVLRKASLIQSDNTTLSTLTDSGRQVWIDQSIQAWNEAVEHVYWLAGRPYPNILAESTITLAQGDRDYALQSDLVELHFPFLDETNGREIWAYPGGYLTLVEVQLQPGNWEGIPIYGAIRPTDGQLYLDRIPTSEEAGLIYKYRYDKDASLSTDTDQFPFSDSVFRAMVPMVHEVLNRLRKGEFDSGLFGVNAGRAAGLLNKVQDGRSWSPRA